jgi:hypothetical protein
VAVGIDLQEGGRARVDRRVGRQRVRQAIMLGHRHALERDAELLGQPDVARRARAVDAIDGKH